MSERILVVDLNARPSECGVCGVGLPDVGYTSGGIGVPMYEDLVLPNDWEGEWFGTDACPRCYALQSAIDKPVPAHLFGRGEVSDG